MLTLRKSFFLLPMFALMFTSTIQAQETTECSGPILSSIIKQYVDDLFESNDEEAILLLQQVNSEIDQILERCTTLSGNQLISDAPGTGTLNDPYAFGVSGDSGDGFSLQINGFVKPADNIIRGFNMFNDRPGPGQVYVLLDVTVTCHETSDRCESNYFEYELVGDRGVVYDNPPVVVDDELSINLFGGGSQSGRLAFLIRDDDTNLRLLYRPNMFEDEVVVYEAEPSLHNGIEITSTTSINVRSTPSTTGSVNASLNANTPVIAFGRNSNATWLQISNGWVFADLVTTSGDVSALPITAE